MKIAIPSENRNIYGNISSSFGRTPYYLIYDTHTKTGDFIENSAADSQGGAGIRAAQEVIDSGAKILLAPRCGENAAEVLKAANIKIYKSLEGTMLENIKSYEDNKLTLLKEIHPGHHGH